MKLLDYGIRVFILARGIGVRWMRHGRSSPKARVPLSEGCLEDLTRKAAATGQAFVRIAGKYAVPRPPRSTLPGGEPQALVRKGGIALVALALASCGGGGDSAAPTPTPTPTPTTYTIGGSVSGLAGTGLVLKNNNGDDLKVSANGTFTFATALNSGASYSVTVGTQPSSPAQTCQVTNGTGTASANVTNVSIACTTTPANYTIGGSVSGLAGAGLVLRNNGGDDLKVAANGSFTFATPIASGSAYAVTVATQPGTPNQVCSVSAGSGNVASANVSTVAVLCLTIGQFAYTANNSSGDISAYTINASSGALTPVAGSPVAVGAAPAAVSLAPNGKFAYVAMSSGTRISGYTINPTTGALTPIPGSPFTTPFVQGHPYPDIAVDPTSKFLYLASLNDNVVAGFAIDGTTGALTPIPGSPFPAGAGAGAIPAFSPNGKFVYVMNQNAASVSGYSVNPTTGALTAIAGSPFATGTTPTWISFVPNGKFAYVSNSASGSISAYAVNATTGALAPLPGSPFAADTYPMDSTIDAAGTHLYVPNRDANNISVYTIDATTGGLSPVAGSPFAAGLGPQFLQIEASGKFAYVTSSRGSDVYAYAVNAQTGALTPVTGNPFAAGLHPGFINIDPSGKFAYTANTGSNNISAYTINGSSGALAPVPGSPVAAGTQPFVVSISPEAPGIRD